MEFALLAPIFFLLVATMLDMSLFYGKRALLDQAVQNGARAVRLGYVQGVRTSRSAFREALCSQTFFLDCDDISFAVKAFRRVRRSGFDTRVSEDGTLADGTFDLGGPNDAIIITAAVSHTFITPLAGRIFGTSELAAANSRPITAHVVMKNEPFPES